MFPRSSGVRVALASAILLELTCGGTNPAAPPREGGRSAPPAFAAAESPLGGAAGQNDPPNPVLRTTPPADPSTSPFPTISGEVPLAVRFNLCRSTDSDEGDSLNYQFNFGDSDRPAFNPDGTFNPDFDHFCRIEHVYERLGTYTATVSLTDKHLEDQGRQVTAFARQTLSLTIVVTGHIPGPPPGSSPPPPTPTPGPTPTPLPKVGITIVANNGAMSYSPNPAHAQVGQRVVWQNADSAGHTATENGGAFDTGFVAPGATSAPITIGVPGTFPYHCQIHPPMVGQLIVN